EMDHRSNTAHRTGEGFDVTEVLADEGEVRMSGDARKRFLAEVHRVEDRDLQAQIQQLLDQRRPDVTGTADDKDLVVVSVVRWPIAAAIPILRTQNERDAACEREQHDRPYNRRE